MIYNAIHIIKPWMPSFFIDVLPAFLTRSFRSTYHTFLHVEPIDAWAHSSRTCHTGHPVKLDESIILLNEDHFHRLVIKVNTSRPLILAPMLRSLPSIHPSMSTYIISDPNMGELVITYPSMTSFLVPHPLSFSLATPLRVSLHFFYVKLNEFSSNFFLSSVKWNTRSIISRL